MLHETKKRYHGLHILPNFAFKNNTQTSEMTMNTQFTQYHLKNA